MQIEKVLREKKASCREPRRLCCCRHLMRGTGQRALTAQNRSVSSCVTTMCCSETTLVSFLLLLDFLIVSAVLLLCQCPCRCGRICFVHFCSPAVRLSQDPCARLAFGSSDEIPKPVVLCVPTMEKIYKVFTNSGVLKDRL